MKKTKKTTTAEEKKTTGAPDFVERDESTETTGEINYETLLNVTIPRQEQDEKEQEQTANIVFYCRDCKELRKTKKKKGKKLRFVCAECGGNSIYFGTEKGIRDFFHIS